MYLAVLFIKEKKTCRKYCTLLHCKINARMQTLDIDVKLTNLKGEAYGYCPSLDKRTFELEIEKIKFKNFAPTVAHEMVHVKQYARAELTEGTWQGKLINPNQSYWDRGYEIEAHGREYGPCKMGRSKQTRRKAVDI